MSHRFFYHVTTQKPLALEQVLLFNAENKNKVFDRSMHFDFKNKEGLDAWDIIKQSKQKESFNLNPENMKVVSDYMEWSIKGYREYILEMVRLRLKPNAPSRMACLYVSETLEEAKVWARYFIDLGRDTHQIVKLEVKGNSFSGNAHHIRTQASSITQQIELAEKYWLNRPHEELLKETIVDGEIKVIDILEEFK